MQMSARQDSNSVTFAQHVVSGGVKNCATAADPTNADNEHRSCSGLGLPLLLHLLGTLAGPDSSVVMTVWESKTLVWGSQQCAESHGPTRLTLTSWLGH